MQHQLSSSTRLIASLLSALLVGLVFGVGLIVSGMSNPAKVIAFLDISGSWDPSLAFVMAGAIAFGIPGFAYVKRHHNSLLELPVQLPAASQVDKKLLLGSLMFGVGWGLAGICPGPALVLIGSGFVKGFWFAMAMGIGMILFEVLQKVLQTSNGSQLADSTKVGK